MYPFKFMLAAAAFLLLLSSCTTQNLARRSGHNDPHQAQLLDSVFRNRSGFEYTLRADDKINISVWDHDDLSVGSIYGIYNSNEVYGKWLMLDLSGNVAVPKLGLVNLMGLTQSQAEEKLRAEYKHWIVNPIVTVKVLNKEVTVLGELKAPGKYAIEKEQNSLLELVGRAGDFDFYANKRKVQVIRMAGGQAYTRVVDLTRMDNIFSQNVQLAPGDIVYVPSRKGKHWDKRAGSTIVPIASVISSIILIASFIK